MLSFVFYDFSLILAIWFFFVLFCFFIYTIEKKIGISPVSDFFLNTFTQLINFSYEHWFIFNFFGHWLFIFWVQRLCFSNWDREVFISFALFDSLKPERLERTPPDPYALAYLGHYLILRRKERCIQGLKQAIRKITFTSRYHFVFNWYMGVWYGQAMWVYPAEKFFWDEITVKRKIRRIIRKKRGDNFPFV